MVIEDDVGDNKSGLKEKTKAYQEFNVYISIDSSTATFNWELFDSYCLPTTTFVVATDSDLPTQIYTVIYCL